MLYYILYASTYSLLRGQPVSQSELFPDLHFTTSPASSAFHSYSYYLLYPPPMNILSDFPPSPPPPPPQLRRTRKWEKATIGLESTVLEKSGEEKRRKKSGSVKKSKKRRKGMTAIQAEEEEGAYSVPAYTSHHGIIQSKYHYFFSIPSSFLL